MAEIPLYVKKLSLQAKIPTRGSSLAAGYDLSAAHDYDIPPRGKTLVMTDLAVQIPPGCYARIGCVETRDVIIRSFT